MRSLWAAPIAVLVLLVVPPLAASAQPSCAEGPQTVGSTIIGTPCDDTIHAPRGITAVYGEGGNDSLYGGRGNDSLYGGEGNDRLYGGIGDDHLRGGPGDDLLSGGFGADSLDGEEGDDFVRGDATIDKIGDSGPATDTDTLSFATGVTPGFPNPGNFGYQGFPESPSGRGVFVDLTQDFANDGLAPAGGGVDGPLGTSNFEDFEKVIGTPFSDLIVGSAGDETIYGGGGADVIRGNGGSDHVFGGAGGDYCNGSSTTGCEFSGANEEVGTRNPSTVSVGVMALPEGAKPALYLVGSDGNDEVSASYAPGAVTFELDPGSAAAFDSDEAEEGECDAPSGGKVVCPLPAAPDSVVLAGLGGSDTLSAPGFPDSTSAILLGGEEADHLEGGTTEDALVDGSGNDLVDAGGRDDAVPNNEGTDALHAGAGDDLFISNAVCEGDVLDGGEGGDNANWANFNSAVSLDLGSGLAGLIAANGQPECASGSLSSLNALEDIEGSNHDDTLIGDAGANQLLGRSGEDSYFAAAGNDSILANSGDSDPVIDCGDGFDTAQIDIPTHNATEDFEDATPVNCEAIYERAPNSFRPPDTPPGPESEPSASTLPASPLTATSPRQPQRDRKPPRTRLLHRPPSVLFAGAPRRTISIAFVSSEHGSTFRCRLDRRPYRTCGSPRRYRVGLGRHTVRVFAIDPAGNRDPSPAVAVFRVRRR